MSRFFFRPYCICYCFVFGHSKLQPTVFNWNIIQILKLCKCLILKPPSSAFFGVNTVNTGVNNSREGRLAVFDVWIKYKIKNMNWLKLIRSFYMIFMNYNALPLYHYLFLSFFLKSALRLDLLWSGQEELPPWRSKGSQTDTT